jgi:hypothetical protein
VQTAAQGPFSTSHRRDNDFPTLQYADRVIGAVTNYYENGFDARSGVFLSGLGNLQLPARIGGLQLTQ